MTAKFPIMSFAKSTVFLTALCSFSFCCRPKPNSPPPDSTGLDIGNEYHNSFQALLNQIQPNPPSDAGLVEIVGVYYYNNYMQRTDMPKRSMLFYLSKDVHQNKIEGRYWIFENDIYTKKLLAMIKQAPDSLSKAVPSGKFTIQDNTEPSLIPSIEPLGIAQIYQQTEDACSRSDLRTFSLDEMSNGEWYAFRKNQRIAVISKHDLENSKLTYLAKVMDRLFNVVYSQYANQRPPA